MSLQIKTNPMMEITKETVRKYICPIATEQEIILFVELCKAHSLNPWIKEAYLIKYGDKYAATLVVSKDVLLKRANEFPDYRGFKAGIIVIGNKGEIIEREGAFYLPETEKLVGGWGRVYRSGKEETVVKIAIKEYIGKKSNGETSSQWEIRPGTMIRKVALAQAHREAYPEAFKGMYIEEEAVPIADNNFIDDDLKSKKVISEIELEKIKEIAPQEEQAEQEPQIMYATADNLPEKKEQIKKPAEKSNLTCTVCQRQLTVSVAEFSQKKHGEPLCFVCQKGQA